MNQETKEKFDKLMVAKQCVYWDYGRPKKCKPTGQFIDSSVEALVYIEVRTGLFAKRWMKIPMLDIVEYLK